MAITAWGGLSMRSLGKLAFAGVSLLAISAPAFAQAGDAPADEAAAGEDQTITVIGTLIRGTQAVGSQTISVDQAAITEKGAGTTNELLSAIPQLAGSFNGRFEIDPQGFNTGTNSVNKPNLRSLPSGGSGATTLVLMDGMRLTPVGVNDAAVDVDIIPSNVLAGIDAVTDGGSSLYGADAVGGVLNFRTMRKYEGLKLDFNYGFGTKVTSYHTWDGSIMAGHSWSTGNAYVSVSHYDRSQVLGGDVPWSSGLTYSAANPNGVYASTQCINPVGSTIKYTYYAPAGVWTDSTQLGGGRTPVGTACDQVASGTYSPETKRTNVFASLTQDFSDSVSLRVTGYWAKRRMYFAHYPVGASTADAAAPTGTGYAFEQRTVQGGTGFSFGANAAYVNRDNVVGFETWGITPELTVKLGSAWQVRASMHYGRSFNDNRFQAVDTTKVTSYINSGQLDPLNVAAASAAVISDITNFETANDTKQAMFLARVVADGPLFSIAAGDVKLAVGAEYQWNQAEVRSQLGTVGSIDSLAYTSKSRNAKSLFAELQIPLFSVLDFSASGRYDSYSDFGSTFNPNLGLTFKPAPWLKIFGHWNTSYNAPTVIDSIGLGSGRLACGIYTVGGTPGTNQRPTDPLGRDNLQGTCALILSGGRPEGLKPQTAKTAAIGFDATPLPGLNFGAELYTVSFNNVIGSLNPANTNTYVTNPNLYIYNGEYTQAQYEALLTQLGNGTAIATQQSLMSNIALIVDMRTSNLNSAKISGVDFHVNYDMDASFGHLSFGVNGNVPTRALITNSGATTNEIGHLNPSWTLSNFVGWSKNRWSAKVTVNMSGPFDGASANYLGVYEPTGIFTMTNLFIGYSIKDSSGPLNGTSFRLNIDNLFDAEPQRIKLSSTNFPSYMNWTLGRVIKLGVTKEF
ncbi:MAG: TonB-dependent receptor [Novosphingobium sp.]